MAVAENSIVQVSCHGTPQVLYAPPVAVGRGRDGVVEINGESFAVAVRRIKGGDKAVVVHPDGEFAFLDYDTPVYVNKNGFTYVFLLAEDFVRPDTRSFASYLIGGLVIHLAVLMAVRHFPSPAVAPDRATAARQGVDVTRVREVLAKVARRNAERQALLRQAKDSFDEPAGAGPAQAPPEPAASPAPPPSNSFLPPGFQGIRRRLVPQKAPVVADRPPLSTGSQTTLPVERERTPSGLSDKGEGPGGGGAGGRGGRGGWGPAIGGAGVISLAAIEEALARNRPKLLKCYEDLLINGDETEGGLIFSWNLDTSARVSRIRLLRSDFDRRPFHLCLAKVIQRIDFPAPTGGAVTIRYPFVFSAEQLSSP